VTSDFFVSLAGLQAEGFGVGLQIYLETRHGKEMVVILEKFTSGARWEQAFKTLEEGRAFVRGYKQAQASAIAREG
jgi:hypothetical protein